MCVCYDFENSPNSVCRSNQSLMLCLSGPNYPILQLLQWLPIIQFKVLAITHKALHSLDPSYLQHHLSPYIVTQQLCSSVQDFLQVVVENIISSQLTYCTSCFKASNKQGWPAIACFCMILKACFCMILHKNPIVPWWSPRQVQTRIPWVIQVRAFCRY